MTLNFDIAGLCICLSVIVLYTVQLSSSADAGTVTSEVDINEVSVPCRNLLTRGVTQDDVCITLLHSFLCSYLMQERLGILHVMMENRNYIQLKVEMLKPIF